MAFLTVLTRHLPWRGFLLARNRESLRRQVGPDYTQRVLVDDVGRGFAQARQMLIDAAPEVATRYVFILDDDDYLMAPDALVSLAHAARADPPGVIFRGWHAELGVLPHTSWGQRPTVGDIGAFDFILRADVFAACVTAQSESDYAHDHAIIAAAYDAHAAEMVWLDRIMACADDRRMGDRDGR
jgi:hypothetical protein